LPDPAAVWLVPLHGIGGRQDLPLPFSLVVAGAAVAVVASFLVLGLAWRTPRYGGAEADRRLPGFTRLVDAAAFRWTVRGLGLAIAGWMTMALLFGKDLLTNPIFGFVYVWVWVGLVPVSLLFGPVWRTLNPLRSLHLLVCRVLHDDPQRGLYRLPKWLGFWPAAAGLYAFAWLELVAPGRVTISVLLLWLSLHVAIMLGGSLLFGQAWFTAADPFETYASLIAHLSVWGRDSAGTIVLRSPLRNLGSLQPRPGLVAVVAVLLGSTAYDGFSSSTAWIIWAQDRQWPVLTLPTAALTGFILLVLVSSSLAAALAGTLAHVRRRALPGLFAHSLIPIVLGYATAHYLTLFILEGQRTALLISDPLGLGWNVFGTAERGVNTAVTRMPGLIAAFKAGAVVGGHILGIIAAHDRALALFPRTAAVVGQLPLLLVMVGYTVGGLLVLFAV
jgi:hypothetical protein